MLANMCANVRGKSHNKFHQEFPVIIPLSKRDVRGRFASPKLENTGDDDQPTRSLQAGLYTHREAASYYIKTLRLKLQAIIILIS